mmetsp:Transcript_135059/g.431571  ORF Transcript_135059/g.431571 Transcript_135059/m.431571 type:complete len:391 (+) Transcript_135059:51-1223(+)
MHLRSPLLLALVSDSLLFCLTMAPFEGLRVQVASDLHLEFYEELPPFSQILQPAAPVLALLGDISALGHPRGIKVYEQFLEECCQHFDLVLLLAGNHEFYSNTASKKTAQDILAYLRGLSASNPKLLVLENDSVDVEGVKIAGTTLWSAIPEHQTVAGAKALGKDIVKTVEFSMNDYRLSYTQRDEGAPSAETVQSVEAGSVPPTEHSGAAPCLPCFPISTASQRTAEAAEANSGVEPPADIKPRGLRVRDTNKWHASAVQFLEGAAAEATRSGMNMLVLTHHTPSFSGTSDPRHGQDNDGFGTAFSTDLEHMFADPKTAATRITTPTRSCMVCASCPTSTATSTRSRRATGATSSSRCPEAGSGLRFLSRLRRAPASPQSGRLPRWILP